MKARLLSFLCVLLMPIGIQAQNAEFETATEAVKNMKVGWNLWNTLEAHAEGTDWFHPEGWWSYETCWGQTITKPELMQMMKEAGFNAIRVPVTWYPHMDINGQVDEAWMQRVHEVVDYVIDQGMYCLLNTHHETEFREENNQIVRYAKLIADEANYDENKEWFEDLWRQIAEEFKDYDEHLVFEGYNEMRDIYGAWNTPDGTHGTEHVTQVYKALNDYAQSFVNAVRSTGGRNLERNLVINTYSACTGPGKGPAESLRQMNIPEDVTTNHIIYGIHCYWFNSHDDVDAIINNVTNYIASKGVPTIVSEWGDYGYYEDEENKYNALHGYFLQQTKANNIATFLWGGMSSGIMRSYPSFDKPDEARSLLKAYYGEWYEPFPEDNRLYSNGAEVCVGKTSVDLAINMANEDAITAFEFEVALPKGVTVTGCSLSDRKADDHSIGYQLQANGNYKFASFSISNTAFSGEDGTLVILKLQLPDNMESGDYPIQIKNIELTTATDVFNPSDCNATLRIVNARTGDTDGNGKVSIFDAVQVVNYILGYYPTGFIEAAADVDGNGKITIFDAVSIVNIILNQNASLSRHYSVPDSGQTILEAE